MDSIKKRFNGLISDFDNRMKQMKINDHKIEEVINAFRSELLNQARIVSTLVELDFIQQSLDFQDEFDRRQIQLFGLNEVNLTLEDLQNGSLARYAA